MQRFLIKLEVELPYDPAIPPLGIHTKGTKTEMNMYPCVHCSTIHNSKDKEATWRPSADEWIRKLWYIYTVEYYSAIKKKLIWVGSNEVVETGAYYIEWSKTERETPIQYINAYIWHLERQ